MQNIGIIQFPTSVLNPKLDKHSFGIFAGACSHCGERRLFAGYDMGRPLTSECFYCEVTREYERAGGWHDDIVYAIAESERDALRLERDALKAKAAGLETERFRVEDERDEWFFQLGEQRARAERLEAELAALKAERQAERKDALSRKIIEMLRTMALTYPRGEVPSSRLWAALVDRGLVATVRPGQAAEGEAHRFYRAKMALLNAGRIAEAKGFVRLVDADAKTPERAPTFAD
jgi:hypothetical protein